MREAAVSKRYAHALLKLAIESNCIDETRSSLHSLLELFQQNRSLRLWLCDEETPRSKRLLLIRELSGKMELGPIVPKFAEVLIQNGRLKNLNRISITFGELADQEQKIIRGTIAGANGEDLDEIRKKLAGLLSSKTKYNVILSAKHDPELIGGLKLKVGSTVWDASVARKLDDIKELLCR